MIPDVIGYEINEALRILKDHKENISLIETCSPKFIKQGECRIVNQLFKNNSLELIISYF